MKRAILLVMFLMMFLNVSHAQENQRWFSVYKDDTSEFFLDRETVSVYTHDENIYVACWIKLNIEDKYMIQKFYFNVETLRYLREKYFFYDKNGEIIGKGDRQNKGWEEPIPASNLEYSLKTIAIAVGNNMKSWNVKIDKTGPRE